MITEKGKEYIARNFGVNNCYALEEVVPCTVYTEGAPNEQVLDTSTILFLLVTEVADWVSTAAGKFTLGDLIAANDGSYISMMEALGIEAYCIAGEPPVTPPVTPPTTPVTPPTVGLKDFEIVSPSVNCDSDKCYARFDLRNNSGSASAYIRVEIDGAPCYKRYVYILRGATKPQVMSTSITGLSSGYHNLTIVVGKITDTDTYTHSFFVGAVGIEPPPAAAKITKAEIIEELGRRGAIDSAAVSTTAGANKWYIYRNRLNWHTANFEKGIEIRNLATRNPPTQVSDVSLTENKMTPLAGLDREWVLARLAELPYVAPPTSKITKAEIISELGSRGAIDTGAISKFVGYNKWYMHQGGLYYKTPNNGDKITIRNVSTRNPPTSTSDISMEKDEKVVSKLDRSWVLARLGELPYKGAVTPPVTPTEPSEAIKAWIVANYGDGTRVTSDSADKLSQALLASNLAPLPAGYTEADITQDVYRWTRDNVGYTVVVDICSWIKREKVENLTINHALYIFYTAKGWTEAANDYFNKITPRPERISGDLATQDNAIAVYYYSREWYDAGNDYSKCNLKG